MKRVLFFVLFVCLTLFTAAQEKPVKKIGFDPKANPSEDVRKAAEEAQKSGKRILLDVGGEWCIWCHRFDAFIHAEEEIASLLEKHYIVVKVNVSKENKNSEFLSNYPKIPGYPHLFVLDSDGKFLHSQDTGNLEKDLSYDRGAVKAFLETWKISAEQEAR